MRHVSGVALILAAAACGSPAANEDMEAADQVQEVSEVEAVSKVEVAPASTGGGGEPLQQLRLQGHIYAIPSAHIRTLRESPQVFVRIKHPDALFELVHDGQLAGTTDRRGVPQIFSVNDGEYPNLDYHEGPYGSLVCRRASAPRGGCGIKLPHGGVLWSVLFSYTDRQFAAEIASKAKATLDGYLVGTAAPSVPATKDRAAPPS